MKRTRTGRLLFCAVTLLSALAASQSRYYFYKPDETRGTDAIFSPLTLLLNGSFDAFRTDIHNNRDLRDLRWNVRSGNVWYNLRSPLYHVSRYGWNRFLREEFLNLSFNVDELQWLPNVSDHTLGYGMLYAKVTEYYDAHGYPWPVVWGVGTSLLYQYTNEMMQTGFDYSTNVDHIADVYFYNTLGFVLFSFDGIKRFFSEDVQLMEWPFQPLLVPRNVSLQNVGQEFVLRYHLPWTDRYATFIYWGVNTVVGISYTYHDRESVSIGLGRSINGLYEQRRGEYFRQVPLFDGAVGIFWDDDGSLLAGIVATGPHVPNIQMNVYPGLIQMGWFSPGVYIGAGKRDGLIAGVTFAALPVSLGFMR